MSFLRVLMKEILHVLRRIFSKEIEHELQSSLPTPRPFRERFLERVLHEEGNGEVGGNNAGPHVSRYTRKDASKPDPKRSWCARGTAYCLEEALLEDFPGSDPYVVASEYVEVPVDEWDRRSRAALGLARMLEAKFGSIGPDEQPEPGLLALWKRPGESWQAHISPVVESVGGLYRVMQFNHGKSPAPVRRTTHKVGDRKFGKLELLKFVRTEPK